jgi:transposase-like protein
VKSTLHPCKPRTVCDHLPERERPWVRAKLRAAWTDPTHPDALASLQALADQLQKVHPGAAGSLREGMQQTLTLTRLGVTGALRRTLSSTNPIESMFDTVRTTDSAGSGLRGDHGRLRRSSQASSVVVERLLTKPTRRCCS